MSGDRGTRPKKYQESRHPNPNKRPPFLKHQPTTLVPISLAALQDWSAIPRVPTLPDRYLEETIHPTYPLRWSNHVLASRSKFADDQCLSCTAGFQEQLWPSVSSMQENRKNCQTPPNVFHSMLPFQPLVSSLTAHSPGSRSGV